MNIVHLPGSLSREGGGVFNVALNHCLQLHEHEGLELSVIGTKDNSSELDAGLWQGIPTKRLAISIQALHQIKDLKKNLSQSMADLFHSHMLWTSQSRVLSRMGTPYVVSPHGMLDPWLMNNKKKVAMALFESKSLKKAACIHALNESEYNVIRSLGFQNPIAIIPNGIDLESERALPRVGKKEKKQMLYLSRIAPKKGLDRLIKAWARIKSNEWVLDVYGWGNTEYIHEIQALIESENACESIKLHGAVHGDIKEQVFADCDAFILPSHSEGFPMVVLEAWKYKKPVLMTAGCNMPEAFQEEAAYFIDNEVEPLADGLREFFNLSEVSRTKFGENAYHLSGREYDWHTIGYSLKTLYRWILNGGQEPSFVRLH